MQLWITLATLVSAMATLTFTVLGYRLIRAQTLPYVTFGWHVLSYDYSDGYLRILATVHNRSDRPIEIREIERRSFSVPSLGKRSHVTSRWVRQTMFPGDVYPNISNAHTDPFASHFRFRVLVRRDPRIHYVNLDVRLTINLFGSIEAKRTLFNGVTIHFRGDRVHLPDCSVGDFNINVHQVFTRTNWYKESWLNRYYLRDRFYSVRDTWDSWGQGFYDWMRDFDQDR